MDLEGFFLKLEPLAAKVVGMGAAVVTPIVDAVNHSVKADPEVVEAVSNSAKELTKNALVWGMDALEHTQSVMAEAEESFRDLVADARAEHRTRKRSETAKQSDSPDVEAAEDSVSS